MDYKQKGVTLYYQIQEYITSKVKSGEWKPQDKIPSEAEFSQMFNVSRFTVRQAISELTAEGMLVKKQGIGTFVSSPGKSGNYTSFSFWDQFGNQHIFKKFSVISSSHFIASCLEIPVGTPVAELYRIRCNENGTPIAIMKSYFSADYFPSLQNANLESRLYDLLKDQCGLTIHHIKSDIEPIIPTMEEAKYLEMPSATDPTLLLCWTCYDFSNKPIILTKHILSRDFCKLSITESYSY